MKKFVLLSLVLALVSAVGSDARQLGRPPIGRVPCGSAVAGVPLNGAPPIGLAPCVSVPQAFVQFNTAFTNPASSQATAFNSNNSLGDTLVVELHWVIANTNPTISVTDTQTNSYTQVGTTVTTSNSATHLAMAVYVATNCKAGANTVTGALSSSQNFLSVSVAEYSGAGGAGAAASGSATSSGAAPSTSSNLAVTTGAGIVAFEAVNSGQAQTAGTNYTLRNSGAAEDWLNATTGSQAVSFGTASNAEWVVIAFVLNP